MYRHQNHYYYYYYICHLEVYLCLSYHVENDALDHTLLLDESWEDGGQMVGIL